MKEVGNFATKVAAMATSLKISRKESNWSSAIQYLPYGVKTEKISPADPEIIRL